MLMTDPIPASIAASLERVAEALERVAPEVIASIAASLERVAEALERIASEVEPPASDPLDESDHRDRLDSNGHRIYRHGLKHWHTWFSGDYECRDESCASRHSLADWARVIGPLTFAPKADR